MRGACATSYSQPCQHTCLLAAGLSQIGPNYDIGKNNPHGRSPQRVGIAEATADCQIADAKLEEAILKKPDLRAPANSQIVRDLRSLRDAAFTPRSYGRHDDCERLLANIRELISGPPMGNLGDNDEDEADKQLTASEPMIQRGGQQRGRRQNKDAKPLIRIDELSPGLRADQIIGVEVRSSDDKIVGEVRKIVFGTKDRRDYAIVASGGFFTPGKDSIVVPIRSLKVSQDRVSFFLPISKEAVKTAPLMPDQDYNWLSDQRWRTGTTLSLYLDEALVSTSGGTSTSA